MKSFSLLNRPIVPEHVLMAVLNLPVLFLRKPAQTITVASPTKVRLFVWLTELMHSVCVRVRARVSVCVGRVSQGREERIGQATGNKALLSVLCFTPTCPSDYLGQQHIYTSTLIQIYRSKWGLNFAHACTCRK